MENIYVPIAPTTADEELPLVELFQDALIGMHDVAAMSWPGTVFLAALTFRLLICLPMQLYQFKLNEKVYALQPFIAEQTEKRMQQMSLPSRFASPTVQKEFAREV